MEGDLFDPVFTARVHSMRSGLLCGLRDHDSPALDLPCETPDVFASRYEGAVSSAG
jgi:hypothetical protein